MTSFLSPSAAQTNAPNDEQFAPLIYPPLTEREGKDLKFPLPPQGHPRLFLRRSDVPALLARAQHPLLQDVWKRIETSAATPLEQALQSRAPTGDNKARSAHVMESKALMYVLKNDRRAGEEAVTAIMSFKRAGGGYRELGRAVLVTAIVYDWCHDLLSAEQKTLLIARMENWASQMEFKWPILTQGSIAGHGVEAQLSRDMLACAVATYDERPDIYGRAAGRLFAEMIPARNFAYEGEFQPQGSSYGNYRFQWEMFTTLIFDRMGYPNIVSKKQGLVPYYWLYLRRPDGQLMRNGDEYLELFAGFGKYWYTQGLAPAASYYRDPILMGETMRQKQIGNDPLFDFLFIDPTVPIQSDHSNLPLTKYFPEPFGAMIARTGWEAELGSNTVIVDLKVGSYNFSNHQHLDAGSFQIYYKGPLAVDSGIYDGKMGAYGGAHFKNYYQRTIAHNSLLVTDPEEKFTWHRSSVSNDGGQRFPAGAQEPANLDAMFTKGYKTGEVLAQGFGPDKIKPEYSYLKGNIAPAYTEKVQSFQRSFVFLNLNRADVPAALLVFDRVEASNPNFKKTWLLHSVEEPVLGGNVTTVKRVELGYDGQLVNTTLLPLADNLRVEKVGGPGAEYSVNGVNYPQEIAAKENSGDGAIWRVEISPKTPAATDHFLNVMQVMPHAKGQSRALPIEKIETERLIGARLADRVVLFSKDGNPISEKLTLQITGVGPSKVFIADLKPGKWRVTSTDGKNPSPGALGTENQGLYFNAQPGTYSLILE